MVNTVPGIALTRSAVVASSVVVHRAMFPAPTSVTGELTVMAAVPEPAPPSLSVTATRTASVPFAPYVCVAVIGFVWLFVLPVVCGEPERSAPA